MVTTRDLPTLPSSGRERILGFVTQTLTSAFALRPIRIYSILERFTVTRAVRAIVLWAKCLVLARPLPLQSLAFFDAQCLADVVEQIGDPADCTVYLDGVRTLEYARRLRRRFRTLHLVCDLDDLMSRRADELLRNDLPIRPGYLSAFMPRFLAERILNGPLRRMLLRYERNSLARAEAELCELCQKVVLLSDRERNLLQARLRRELAERATTIEPAFRMRTQRGFDTSVERFIFVGTDRALQNQLSIEFLMALWKDHRPRHCLHIYGHMTGAYEPIDGVRLEGYADFASIYAAGSVALCPAFLKGGVKTKVLEALEYGVAPIGNAVAFEGIDSASALRIDDAELAQFIKDPATRMSVVADAAARLQADLARRQDAALIAQKWIAACAPRRISGRRGAAQAKWSARERRGMIGERRQTARMRGMLRSVAD